MVGDSLNLMGMDLLQGHGKMPNNNDVKTITSSIIVVGLLWYVITIGV
jgi:hypothetical protein